MNDLLNNTIKLKNTKEFFDIILEKNNECRMKLVTFVERKKIYINF